MWTRSVPIEDEAKKQLANAARLPIALKQVLCVKG
jgi:tRNA-splicing ligase RtcB (3'-phosphate/5'-hydroxy nucleic acid ligase)